MKNTFLLLISILSFQFSFSQCDEYYINKLISGHDNLQPGSKIRFCPSLNGVSIAGELYKAYKWSGVSTQYITLSQNGGIAGFIVLDLKNKKFEIKYVGATEAEEYYISLNESDFNNYYNEYSKPIDNPIIKSIDSLYNLNETEMAYSLYKKLLIPANYINSKKLIDKLNIERTKYFQENIKKANNFYENENYLESANLLSKINALKPTDITYQQTLDLYSLINTVGINLQDLYKDSTLIVDEKFSFNNYLGGYNPKYYYHNYRSYLARIFDSIQPGNYFMKLNTTKKNNVKYEDVKSELIKINLGFNFQFKNDTLVVTEIDRNSEIEKNQIKVGDKIISVNNKLITANNYHKILNNQILLTINSLAKFQIYDSNKKATYNKAIKFYETKITDLPVGIKFIDSTFSELPIDMFMNIKIKSFALDPKIYQFKINKDVSYVPIKIEKKQKEKFINYYTKEGIDVFLIENGFYKKTSDLNAIKISTLTFNKIKPIYFYKELLEIAFQNSFTKDINYFDENKIISPNNTEFELDYDMTGYNFSIYRNEYNRHHEDLKFRYFIDINSILQVELIKNEIYVNDQLMFPNTTVERKQLAILKKFKAKK
jgi:hypothetical protein